jgi:hypothetical protein
MLSAPEKVKFLFNHYSIIDLLCFSAVYAGFWHRQLAPSDAIYNVYLLQAPFRFLRFRRALQSLDKPVRSAASSGGRGADELAIYRLGPLMLSRRTAFLVLLVLRVVLFICSAASLFLALEFPCEALVDASIVSDCSAQLRRFHVAVYFTVVTLSTVGYGDVSAKTDAGRIMVTAFIISALVGVPREIQKFSDLETEVRAREEQIKRRITEERNKQQQQQQRTSWSARRLPHLLWWRRTDKWFRCFPPALPLELLAAAEVPLCRRRCSAPSSPTIAHCWCAGVRCSSHRAAPLNRTCCLVCAQRCSLTPLR